MEENKPTEIQNYYSAILEFERNIKAQHEENIEKNKQTGMSSKDANAKAMQDMQAIYAIEMNKLIHNRNKL